MAVNKLCFLDTYTAYQQKLSWKDETLSLTVKTITIQSPVTTDKNKHFTHCYFLYVRLT